MSTLEKPIGPIKNRLGHNGPYFGLVDPVERDCQRIPGHTELFRKFEMFEFHLGVASAAMETKLAEIAVYRPREAMPIAKAALELAEKWFHEAHLMAAVLNDREQRRLHAIGQGEFDDRTLRLMDTTELEGLMRKLETRSHETRRMITTIHQVRRQRAFKALHSAQIGR